MTTTFEDLGHQTPDADLAALSDLGNRCSVRRFPNRTTVAVEVGSWAGRTALVLADEFSYVYCIDHWEGNPEDRLGALATLYGPKKAFVTFCRNMGDRLCRDVFPCVGRSRTWASVWTVPIDLLFIDADHRYEFVSADLRAWMPHVRPGGMVCCHDYGEFEGVTRAVDELLPGFKFAGFSIAYWEKPHE